jgi:uncharacterized protein (TIGR02099 family)
MRVLKHGTLWTYRIAMAVVLSTALLGAAAYGTVRFWLLPNIDSYRPAINRAISQAARQHIEIGRIEGELDGLRPRLTLFDVQVYDRAGAPRLALDAVHSTLSWTSVLAWEPRFHNIDLHGLELEVRRDETGAWSVAGIGLDGTPASADEGLVDWLLQQDGINLRGSELTWIDERLSGLPLKLGQVEFSLTKRFQQYRFALSAVPPLDVAAPLKVSGELQGVSARRLMDWQGKVYFEVGYADLAVLRQWVELPLSVSRGAGGLQVWVEFARGALRGVTADVGLSEVRARLRDDLPELELTRLQGRLRWQTLPRLREFSAERLAFTTPDGVRLEPSTIRYRRTGGEDDAGARSEIAFTALDLAAVSRLVDRLPFDQGLRDRLAEMRPRGRLRDFSVEWEGEWNAGGRYRAKGRFDEIAVSPTGYLPGIGSVTGQLDLDHARGAVTLRASATSLDMPRVFVEPLPLDSLNARLSWTMAGGLPTVRLESVELANPHLAARLAGTYSAAAEGPGAIDVGGTVNRLDGRQAWRYVPLVVHPNVRDWLRGAILAGTAPEVRFKARGQLRRFPWNDEQAGLLEVTTVGQQAVIEYAKGWPQVEFARAELRFRGHRMDVTSAEARILGTRLSSAAVSVPDLGSRDPLLELRGEAEGPSAEFLAFIANSPVDRMVDGFTREMQASGRGRLTLSLDLPLHRMADVRVRGRYRFTDNTLMPGAGIPRLDQFSGELAFDEQGVSMRDGAARILGSPARFSIDREPAGGVRVQASGRIDGVTLGQQLGRPAAGNLSGAADWRASISLRGQRYGLVLESDLVGLSSALPPPFAKAPRTVLPLRVEKHERTPDLDQVAIALGGTAFNGQLLVERAGGRVVRGEWAFNAAAPAPQRDGVWAGGRLERLDLDLWRRMWEAAEPAAEGAADGSIAGLRLRVGELRVGSRALGELDIDAQQRQGTWQWTLSGRDVAGALSWSAADGGRLAGRLTRLFLPAATEELRPPAQPSASRPKLPAMDLSVDDFRLSDRQFGRLALRASPAGEDWRIEQLEMRGPEGTLNVSGVWQAGGARPATRLDVDLDMVDMGRYFARVKLPPGIKGGSGKLAGQLAWGGPPYAPDLPSLSGAVSLDFKRGQFVKLEPGLGKLIGVLSLQALPRRVTLDFADVFSEGFTFDRISATANVAQGVARTGDFRMVGPTAKVDLRGRIDLAAETQSLEVSVKPSVSESIALGAAIVNPAVGLATFLAQKALQDPIEKMVAFEYEVTGTWQDPVVTRKRRPVQDPGPAGRR